MTVTDQPPQLVALDIDGTIINYDESLSDAVYDAVRDTRAAGYEVVLATGRALMGTLPIARRLGIETGYLVCSNGAVTVRLDQSHSAGFVVEHAEVFDPTPALKLLRDVVPNAAFAVEQLSFDLLVHGDFPHHELDGDVRRVSFEELFGAEATRVVVRSLDHSSEEFLRLIDDAGLHGVNYFVGWTAWLDIAPEDVTKAVALDRLCQQLGIPPSRVLAVGDGRNDIEMFEWAGDAVAMGQASEPVLAAAARTAASVDDDGLTAVLRALPGVA